MGFVGANSNGNAPGTFMVLPLIYDELIEVSITLAAEFLKGRRAVP